MEWKAQGTQTVAVLSSIVHPSQRKYSFMHREHVLSRSWRYCVKVKERASLTSLFLTLLFKMSTPDTTDLRSCRGSTYLSLRKC